jgi:LAO/AO transport system kinase
MPSKKSPRRRDLTLDQYEAGVRAGDVAVLPRALTLVESNLPAHQEMAEQLITRLLPFTRQSIRVGITGVPGVGKSTFIEALGLGLVEQGNRIAVLAIDPSSGISGGSILGDKTRMPGLSASDNAYIRPSPSAGTTGGVARKTRESIAVCEAAGFDVVLIETVGVGQTAVAVAQMTDCFLALMLPGAGDELQGIKRGLLELVDVLAVNKADGPTESAAKRDAQQYAIALTTLVGADQDQIPAVLTCSSLTHQGIDAVWDAVVSHHQRLVDADQLTTRRQQQQLDWLWSLVEQRLRDTVYRHAGVEAIRDELEKQVVSGHLPPEAAARRIIQAFTGES